MNKLLISTAITAACCSFSTHSFEDETTGIYLNLGVNHVFFEKERNIKDDNDLYLGLGYQINDNWGVEVERTNLDTKLDSGSEYSVDLWSLNAIYRQFPKGTDSVFWKIGAAEYRGSGQSDNDQTVRLGMGYDFALTDSFSWVLGADTTMTDTNGPDFILYTGMSYFFGSTQNNEAVVPVAAPKMNPAPQSRDSDNDGVVDASDQCPSTSPNAQVDAKGCELDSDNDGVVNSLDKCLNTPAGAKVDATGCRIVLTKDVSIKMNVQFANNSSIISADNRAEIEKVAKFMQQYPDTNVVIEGHTDDRGAAEYNKQLSQKRATAVMAYLVKEFSIDQSRASAEGKGEENPIADNNTAEGRAENRRVQAEIKTTVAKPQ